MAPKKALLWLIIIGIFIIGLLAKSCSGCSSKKENKTEYSSYSQTDYSSTYTSKKNYDESNNNQALKTAFVELPDNTTVESLKKYCKQHSLYYAEYEDSYSFKTIYYKVSYDEDCALNEYGGGKNDYLNVYFDSEENNRNLKYISYHRGDIDRGKTTAYRYFGGYLDVNHEPLDAYFVTAPRTNGYYKHNDAKSALNDLF